MAFPLESFVNSVKTLSSQGNLSCLYEFLENSADLLSKNTPHLEAALAALDVQQHSLGVLAVLLARFTAASAGGAAGDAAAAAERQMEEFVEGCTVDQIRYAPDSYAELCHLYTARLLAVGRPIKGLRVLPRAIAKIQAGPHQLTSIHADICQLALSARCFRPALAVLEDDIADISKENGKLDAKHVLLYFYYGGMVYAAVKQYQRALYFFEIYFAVPALAVSHIALEAYKKHLLISLILRVEAPQLQKLRYHESQRQTIVRRLRPLCPAYTELATSFSGTHTRPDQLLALVDRHREQFNRDNNMGLVRQCVQSFHKMSIQRLTKTFVTLSLEDVAARVQLPGGPARAQTYLLAMIEDGEIFASIDQRDGMVRFHDDPEQYASPETVSRLERELATVMALGRRVQQLDEEIQTEPAYIQKAHKSAQEDDSVAPSSSQNNKVANNLM